MRFKYTSCMIANMTSCDNLQTKFHTLIQEQIYHEFAAVQQYLAIAVYFDGNDLPQLAQFFYKHADEERNHAMMFVQYLLDRNIHVEIPGIEPVRNNFQDPQDALTCVLEQERLVTQQMTRLAGVARDEGDYIGEQFIQWFLREQVEEVSLMTTLLRVATRAAHNLFDLENFVDREINNATPSESYTPKIAGSKL